MTPAAFMAVQTAIEALPEEVPAQASWLAVEIGGAGGGSLDLLQLVVRAAIPVQLIMALLLLASAVSWVIIFRKCRTIARARDDAERFEECFWSGARLHPGRPKAGAGRIGGLEAIFDAGFHEFARRHQCKKVDARIHLEGAERAMRATGSREIHRLEHNLELLANIGSTAPYIGLVGTVFGIMVTMHDLVASEAQVGIKDVAPGISEALLATAMGLFVAIPAVWTYNHFAKGVEQLTVRYNAFAEELFSMLQRQVHTGVNPRCPLSALATADNVDA